MSQLAVSQNPASPHLEGIPLAPAAPAPLADCSPEQVAERRYLAILDPLLNEAWEQHQLETLVDCLAWTLARVVVGLDSTQVTGDLLRRLGNYTYRLSESRRAEAEAEQAKKEGRAPN
ncbi:MAG: hypothetical protein IPN24_00110 [Betaproteobacteria bacterium]|nr:hypothetical protein [Betaproteobacteria bacterium]